MAAFILGKIFCKSSTVGVPFRLAVFGRLSFRSTAFEHRLVAADLRLFTLFIGLLCCIGLMSASVERSGVLLLASPTASS